MKDIDTNPWVLFKTHLQRSQMVLPEGDVSLAVRIQFELISSPVNAETQTQTTQAFYAAPAQLVELAQAFLREAEFAGGVQSSPLDEAPMQ